MVLTPEQIFQAFDEAEQTLPVANWTIGDLRVWPIVRNYHAYLLCTQKAFDRNNEIAAAGTQITTRLRQIAKTCIEHAVCVVRDRVSNDVLRPTDVLIAAHSSTRYFQVEGRWYNPYSDSVTRHLRKQNLDALVLEFTGDGKYLAPRFNKSIYVQARSFLISVRAKLASKMTYARLPETLDGWDEFLALLDRRLGPGCRPSLDSVRFRAHQVLGYERWVSKMIARTAPKVGIVTGYYSTDMMGFVRAFRKASLLSVEIQHGVQGTQHFAYRKWNRIPLGGYDTLPEVFWSWSKTESDYINSWAAASGGGHRAVVGGNPCLHIYDHQGRDYRHEVKGTTGTGQSKAADVNVLFTAQAFNQLPQCVLDAMHATPEWKWWIRTHPQYVEAAQSIRKICRAFPNVVVEEADSLPLGVLLNHCDVHVTEFSSSVLESKAKGVRSVIVNPIGIELFKDLIASGEVLFVDQSAELVRGIVQQAAQCRRPAALASADDCFFSDVMTEIVRAAVGTRQVGPLPADQVVTGGARVH